MQELQQQIEFFKSELQSMKDRVQSITESNQSLKEEIQSIKNGGLEYVGFEYIKRNIFEDTKPNSTGATPIFSTYDYSGAGTFHWASTNAPDMVLVINYGGKRYWLPAFIPN